MARTPDDRPRKRFARSGHTSHTPGHVPQAAPTQHPQEPYQQPQYAPPPQYPPQQYPPQYPGPGGPYGSQAHPPVDYGQPTYHHTPGGRASAEPPREPATPAVAMTKAAFTQTNRAARLLTRKVISASKADGAHESGLTALIWNQVLSYGTDAMITVALAGTVFFGASADAKRGNVLLYLLVTMAPFAVVAPVIGPLLDRFQHGRRWTMAGTAVGRAILALIMSLHPTELIVLYPCALGSLVLSKAYSVVRAAAAPRLVPPGLSLTETNARLSIFGLGSTMVLGAFVGVLIKVSGSYSLGLVVTALGFAACAFFAFRLPPQVDSAVDATGHIIAPPPRAQPGAPIVARLRLWAGRGFGRHAIVALQGESTLRFISGLLTIFLAFYVESTAHGLQAALQLGAVIAAAGAGNVTGTAIGSKVKLTRPEAVIVVGVITAAATCLLVALLFEITLAVVGMYLSAVINALAKIALDAVIQRDVKESLRTSAFARSETFLQLAWVIGAAVGVALPTTHRSEGALGFWVAGGLAAGVATFVVLRERAMRQATPPGGLTPYPGTVAPRPPEPQ